MTRRRRKNPFQFLTKKFPKRMQKKLVMLFVAIILAFVVLVGRVTYINARSGDEYTRVVLEQQQYDSQTIPYKRGDITDRNGTKLATSERVYNVILDVKALKSVKEAGVTVKGCSHITGGGFYENIPRMLPDGVRAVVKKDSYPVLPIFKMLQEEGNITEEMMYNTFNMGLGMVLAVDPADVDKTMEALKAAGETPYVVGSAEAGEKGVTLC